MSQNTYYGYDFIKESGGIKEYKLKSNGLNVLVKEDGSAPVATFMVTYRVGSRNEVTGNTGSTHLLEHLMFKGSKKFNTKKGNTVFQVLQSFGARVNATTWLDRTNYYATMPSNKLEVAIEIEADRMRNAFIKEEDRQSEMTVVRNEFERGQNSPTNVLDEHLWATAYQAHPYHHSTIGWKSDIENVSIEKLKEFYDTFYWPNNATAIVVGDFETKDALAQIKKHFGKIGKSRNEIPVVYTEEPKQEGKRTVTLKRAGQVGVLGVAHKSPSATSDDAAAMMVLSSILSSGKNSRFYKKLTDKGLTTSVYIYDTLFKDPGLFTAYATLSPGTAHDKVEKIIIDEYENIKKDGVSIKEVERAKTKLITRKKFNDDGGGSSASVAFALNEAIGSGDWTLYTSYIDRVQSVTPEKVKEVAKRYLNEDLSTVGYFIPKQKGGEQPQDRVKSAEDLNSLKIKNLTPVKIEAGKIESQIVVSEPVSGIKLYTLKNGSEVTVLTGNMLGGTVFSDNERIPSLVASMLDEGTENKTKFEISDTLENIGANLSFYSGQTMVGFDAKFLTEDTGTIISLLSEQLKEPAFEKKNLEVVKKSRITSLKRSKESTSSNASKEMLSAFYGKNQQNSPTEPDLAIEKIKKITTEDLKNFHKKHYGRGSMVVVAVGGVDHTDLSKKLKEAFSDWGEVTLNVPQEKGEQKVVSKTKYVTLKDKTSTHLYFGTPLGIDRNNEDYMPLVIASQVLGGSFSGRLMQAVRVRDGLTYGIYSGIAGFGNNNKGYWYAAGTFAPELLSEGEDSSLGVISEWIEKGITKEELEVAKSTLTGSYQVGFDSNSGLADGILNSVVVWNDLSYVDKYIKKVNEVSLKQVNDAIKKYIKPEGLFQVAAGSIDEEGRPLAKEED